MQVEAIYNQGSIQFVHPLRLKRDHVRLLVTVPDEELASPPAPEQVSTQTLAATSYAARLDHILAPFQHLLQSHTAKEPMDYQAIREAHLAEKHLGSHEKSDI